MGLNYHFLKIMDFYEVSPRKKYEVTDRHVSVMPSRQRRSQEYIHKRKIIVLQSPTSSQLANPLTFRHVGYLRIDGAWDPLIGRRPES